MDLRGLGKMAWCICLIFSHYSSEPLRDYTEALLFMSCSTLYSTKSHSMSDFQLRITNQCLEKHQTGLIANGPDCRASNIR